MNLNCNWKIWHFDIGVGIKQKAHTWGHDDSNWLITDVPSDVQTAFFKLGKMPDPFKEQNIEEYGWMEQKEWWYRKTFTIDSKDQTKRLFLKFNGLDTYADIWINGNKVGRHENMFIEAEFDVTDFLKVGQNLIAVKFDSTEQHIQGKNIEELNAAHNVPRIWVRKSQMNFGWDWGPRLVSTGIWQGVELNTFSIARIESAFAKTITIANNTAVVEVDADIEVLKDCDQLHHKELQVRFSFGQSYSEECFVVNNMARVRFEIEDPKLWWIHGLGKPNLYNAKVELINAKTGKVLDKWEKQIGLRTIDLLQEPDQDGKKSFTFVLNGKRVFCKGVNWIPADSLHCRVEKEKYEDLIKLARESNMNMIRVWGGGIYEPDEFYETCNKQGILVWQDFMFACGDYPDWDEQFIGLVREEAELVVKRLRNHPCLALWCGNNENLWLNKDERIFPFYGLKIYERILPSICAALDPYTPYWPGSPDGGHPPNCESVGDLHNWEVWHGKNEFRVFAEDQGRFISEFGLHASPVLSTLQRNISCDLKYESPDFLYRIKDDDITRKDSLMQSYTGLPENVDEYERFSMLCQAEGLKYAVEHYRRRKFECSGALIWQLNDCWPGVSWSLIDYYLQPKASYYYIKKAFSPLLLSFKDEAAGVSIWLINDTQSIWSGKLQLLHQSFDGRILASKSWRISVNPNEVTKVDELPFRRLNIEDKSQEYLRIKAIDNKDVQENHYFFVPQKEMILPEAHIDVKLEGTNIKLYSNKFVRMVRFEPMDCIQLSDNFFDLYPEEHKTIKIGEKQPGARDKFKADISWLR